MTNRIEDLREKATENLMGMKIVNPTEFARLIIDECIQCAQRGSTGADAARIIKLNFGVTE